MPDLLTRLLMDDYDPEFDLEEDELDTFSLHVEDLVEDITED